MCSTGAAWECWSCLRSLDQDDVLTVSSMTVEVAGVHDVCLSLPRILGARGIEDSLLPAMTQAELDALGASARMLKDTTDELFRSPEFVQKT